MLFHSREGGGGAGGTKGFADCYLCINKPQLVQKRFPSIIKAGKKCLGYEKDILGLTFAALS